jgi:hypothetical protein
MLKIKIVSCGDCGFSTLGAAPDQLGKNGWKLLRLRDGYSNPVLWWRCGRCVAAGAPAMAEDAPVTSTTP